MVKAVISVAFFMVLISFVQANELLHYLRRINWFYFSLSLLLGPLLLLASCWKWSVILGIHDRKTAFVSLARIYFIGYFFSNLLPSTVGGDVARSLYAGKLIADQPFSAVSVFIERVSGLFLLLVLVVVAPLMRPSLYHNPFVFVPACCAFFLLGLFFWLGKVRDPLALPGRIMRRFFSGLYRLAGKSSHSWFRRGILFLQRLQARIFDKLSAFHGELKTALVTIRHNQRLFITIVALTILFYFLTWLNVYIAFRAFGIKRSLWEISALVPTIMVVGQLPVTLLGNLGFFESVYVFYFLLIGIPPEGSLAMGLLMRLKMLLLGCIGFLVYLSYKQGDAGEDDPFFFKSP